VGGVRDGLTPPAMVLQACSTILKPGNINAPPSSIQPQPPSTHTMAASPPIRTPASPICVQDIQVIPGTSNPKLCMLSDEYSPSVAVFNCEFGHSSCGEVRACWTARTCGQCVSCCVSFGVTFR
jgi:hypothetical protein